MGDTAAHLVDRVLPSAGYRQIVLSFPYPLRFHLARDPAFLSQMLAGFLQSVFAWQRHRGRRAGINDGHTGAITFVQKFGAALNANLHFHSITPQGLFVPSHSGHLELVPLPPPSDLEVERLTFRIARRLTKIANRYLVEHDQELFDPTDEHATLQQALSTALRPPLRPQPDLPFGAPQPPQPEKPLCAVAGGFSLHAARTVDEHNREGLEQLCRYGLRAPFAQSRLSLLPDGRVHYKLPRPWPTASGVTELVLEPLQFLKRLAALLPAPFQNLVRYHGVFANRSHLRPLLPRPPQSLASEPLSAALPAQPKSGKQDEPDNAPTGSQDTPDLAAPEPGGSDDLLETEPPPLPASNPPLRARRLPWACLLKRTLRTDGLKCPVCQTQMVLLALITASDTVKKILDHLRIPATPPPLAPARLSPFQDDLLQHDLDQNLFLDEPPGAARLSSPAAPRAPP